MFKRALVITALLVAAAPLFGQAIVTQENAWVPIDFVITACNGEEVIFTGESHVVQHSTGSNASVGIVHINFHLVGVGASGTRYIVNEHVNGENIFAGADTFTSEARLTAVAQGNEDNLMVHTFIHSTINANGELTTETFVFESDCQG